MTEYATGLQVHHMPAGAILSGISRMYSGVNAEEGLEDAIP